MKIDMLSTLMNLGSGKDIKKDQCDKEFLNVFASEFTELESNENIKSLVEDENHIEDELMAAIVAIINRILSIEVSEVNSEELQEVNSLIKDMASTGDFNGEKLKEILSGHNLKELYGGKSIEDLLKNLKVDLNTSQNLEMLDLKEGLLKFLNKTIGTDKGIAVKENLDTLMQVGQQKHMGQEISMDYMKFSSSEAGDKENQIFNVETLKHRNIIVEEKPSNTQGELSLLNRIAFSTENVTEVTKETAPIVVRNEFLGSDVLKVVKYINNNRIEELNVKITPEELGEVNIKLIKLEDNNELIITLTNKKAYELIKENVSDIQKHLSNLDIKIKDVIIQVKNEGYDDFSGSFNEQFNKNNSEEKRKNNFSNNGSSFKEEEENNKVEDTSINLLI